MTAMLVVNAPLMGDKITKALAEYHEGGVSFNFVSKNGLRLKFEVLGMDGQQAVDLAKRIISGQDFGKSLYFMVSFE